MAKQQSDSVREFEKRVSLEDKIPKVEINIAPKKIGLTADAAESIINLSDNGDDKTGRFDMNGVRITT